MTPPLTSLPTDKSINKEAQKKNSPSSSSSGTHSVFNESQWLFPFPMLELLPNQTQNYVCRQITKQAVKKGLKQNDIDVYNDIRFLNIIRPYRRLNEFLHNTPRRNLAVRFVHLMLYDPFTISDITLAYDFEKRRETKAFQSFVRRIANLLINCKLLDVEVLKPKKYGIPENPKFYPTLLYYNPNLITKEDLIYDETAGQIIKSKQIDAELGRSYKTAKQKAHDHFELKATKYRILRGREKTPEPESISEEEYEQEQIQLWEESLNDPNISESTKQRIKSQLEKASHG